MTAFYNEIDPFAAQWLRNLIDAGLIAPGVVDTRSIEDIAPDELRDYTQVHFFAGIGVWSYSLRLAGWPDNRPVWTGSCPCQPFSQAGKGSGVDDERHLWPHFHWLIQQCQPETVFGEQVASKDGLAWFDTVFADLERTGYASAALDLCAAGVGAPHIRQRLYWMAHRSRQFRERSWRAGASGRNESADGRAAIRLANNDGEQRHVGHQGSPEDNREGVWDWQGEATDKPARRVAAGGLGNANGDRTGGNSRAIHSPISSENRAHQPEHARTPGEVRGLEHPSSDGRQGWLFGGKDPQRGALDRQAGRNSAAGATLQVNGFWRDADWLSCRDGVWRPVEPGTFPLVDGTHSRVGRLRAYGNAIVAPLAQAFIEAATAAIEDIRQRDLAKAPQ